MAAQRDRALGTRLWGWHCTSLSVHLSRKFCVSNCNAVFGALLQQLSGCSKTHLVQIWYYVHVDNRNEHSNNSWEVSLKSPQWFAKVVRAIWDVQRITSVATELNCDCVAVAWVGFLPSIFLLRCRSSVGTVNPVGTLWNNVSWVVSYNNDGISQQLGTLLICQMLAKGLAL